MKRLFSTPSQGSMMRKASSKRTKVITGGTSSETSPAEEAIANNLDLLTEILLRLPAKSLIRFESVSKHWLSLISHPKFSTNHSSRNPSPSISGLYICCDNRLSSVSLRGHRNLPSLSFLDGLEGKYFPTTIQHSCNGLLLFQTHCFDPNDYRLTLYIVCNPTTHKYTVLPKTGFSHRLARFYRDAYLAFDPSKSPHYKVVVVSRYELPSFEIDVYNSETGNWKNIGSDVYNLESTNWEIIFCHGQSISCSCGDAIHWLGYRDTLLKFDIDAEKMLTLSLPQTEIIIPHMNFFRSCYFGECGGSLILVRPDLYSTKKFQIQVFECKNSHWVLKYKVNLRTIVSAFLEIENDFKYFVLCVFEGEEKEDYSLVLVVPGKVISYNLKCKKFDVLRELVPGELIHQGDNCFGYPFAETLSPV